MDITYRQAIALSRLAANAESLLAALQQDAMAAMGAYGDDIAVLAELIVGPAYVDLPVDVVIDKVVEGLGPTLAELAAYMDAKLTPAITRFTAQVSAIGASVAGQQQAGQQQPAH